MKKLAALLLCACVFMQTAVFAALPTGVGVTTNNIENSVIRHEKSVAYEGRASMYINIPISYTPNKYVYLTMRQCTLESAKKYRLSFYVKGKDGGRAFYKWMWDWSVIWQSSTECTDWKYVSHDFSPQTDGNWLSLIVDDKCDYYLDNVSICEIDEEGNTISENLMSNGGFEKGDFEPCGNVSEVETTPMDKAVELKWKNPMDADFNHVDIYMIDSESDDETFVKSVTPGKYDGVCESYTTAVVDGLENDKLYFFKLYAIDDGDNMPSGTKTFGKPIGDDYYVTDFKAMSGNNEIDSLSDGDITISADFKNNKIDGNIVVRLITVLYKENRLIAVSADEKSIAKDESAQLSTTVTVNGLEENMNLYGFIWDDEGNILHKSLNLTNQ